MGEVCLALRRMAALRFSLIGFGYAAAVGASLWTAYELRFDFGVPSDYVMQFSSVVAWAVLLKVVALYGFGQFRELLSYFSAPDLKRVTAAVSTGSVLLLGMRLVWPTMGPPLGVILADWVLSLGALCFLRLMARWLREQITSRKLPRANGARRVAIIGAGDAGVAVARQLFSKPRLGLQPVAFFDDSRTAGLTIFGIPVAGKPELLPAVASSLDIQEAIIAIPEAPAKRMGEIVRLLQKAQLKHQTVPSMEELATGKIKVSNFRPVEIQDLLGRATVEVGYKETGDLICGTTVMVTGAGGSIGSELCRQIARFKPGKLLLVERSEAQLFPIEQELIEACRGLNLVPLVADITNGLCMKKVFRAHRPQLVFHAAAHKHVPMMEGQPAEAIRNNVFGTAQLAELAVEHGVERFLLISTDKAINPTNVMGATKRVAEIFVQSLQERTRKTKLMAVRFGNVLGSSGSVVPLFARQIAAGGPVKVTHPDVTRYFMTIPEAVRLVLQSIVQAHGGEIFVLDMGQPVKIVDLAKQMISLSGYGAGEIDIEFVGLRPGEKLYEELSHKGENVTATNHPKIMRFVSQPQPMHEVRRMLSRLRACLRAGSPEQLKEVLQEVVPEYRPYLPKNIAGPQREVLAGSLRSAETGFHFAMAPVAGA